ncbi:SDR family NAD(P)-dependent oxidoreductase [Pokkaliibacter sp. CJK22405]|uniref:SDR family NAD(P)-dependent oxidoreductase n=1 Tax=Pokkaliibacter sp. CJK22405 TaxID=3384615 RepID=UPI003984734D
MSKKLEGKTALITGGSTGIGKATLLEFVAQGATVFITGRRQKELDAAVAEAGSNAIGIQGDISNLADLDCVFAEIAAKTDHLDIVFANAGVGDFQRFGEITEEHFDKAFNINVKGTLFTVQKALPLMREGGSVILTGSTTGSSGTENFSVYSATKAAIRNFARNWILDLKPRGIRVNTLSPGPVKTPGALGLVPDEAADDFMNQMASLVPLGRVGEPREIARVAVFLASDDSSFVNGAEIFADGGAAQI